MEVEISQDTVDSITRKLSQHDTEKIMAGYLTGRVEEDRIVIEDVYIPEQFSNHLITEIKGEHRDLSIRAIKDSGKSIVGFVQYNAGFAVFENMSVRNCIDNLAQERVPRVGLVVNARKEYQVIDYLPKETK